MEVSDQLHFPAALPPGKEPLVPVGPRARINVVDWIYLAYDSPNGGPCDTVMNLRVP